MNLETAIRMQGELTDLANLSRKGCKGHWENFGFTHGYGSYELNLVDLKVGDVLPMYWYEIVSDGKKDILCLMPQISAILNKHVEAWNISYNSAIKAIVINIP